MTHLTRMTAAALLLAGVALAPPIWAADSAQAPAKRHHAGLETGSKSGVEARIADLHAKFGITAAQEAQWTPFAQVMRDNTQAYNELAKQRTEQMKSMTAPEDLRSFQ